MEILREIVKEWKYRQTCNNQPEQNKISKAKAHIYGICSDELMATIKLLEDGKVG